MKNLLKQHSNKLTTVLCIGLMFGCVKKEFDQLSLPNATPEIVAPVLNTTLEFNDLVDIQNSDLEFQKDADGFLTLVYFEEIFSQRAKDLINIPDQNFSETVSFVGAPGPTQTATVNDQTTITVNGGQLLDSMILKGGSMTLQMTSSLAHNVDVTLTFNNVRTSTGAILQETFNLTPTSQIQSRAIDLNGISIDLSNGGTANNELDYTMQVTVTQVGVAPITGDITLNADIQNIEFSYLQGYLGQPAISLPQDTVDVDIFDNSAIGNIFFEDPKAVFRFENSLGIPFEAEIVKIEAIQNDGSSTTPILIDPGDETITVNAPTPAQAGSTITSEILLDVNNTGGTIRDAFNPTPNRLIFDVDVTANPSGPSQNNFTTDTSRVAVIGEVQIPLHGNTIPPAQYALSDTITDIDLPDTTDSENIESATLRFRTINSFPVDARVQAYFYDQNDVFLDSLFIINDQLARSGQIDGTGKVIAPTTTDLEETFNHDRYLGIQSATKVVIIGYLVTTNGDGTKVRIFEDNNIKLELGIRVKGNVDFDDL